MLPVFEMSHLRFGNCDGCGDTNSVEDTTQGSHAYNYDISADGNYAVFDSFRKGIVYRLL